MGISQAFSSEDIKRSIELAFKIKSAYDVLKIVSKFGNRAVRKLRDMLSEKSPKILLIGGGEIGTEIAAAALKNWKVRALIKENPSPIINLHYYMLALGKLKAVPHVEDFEIKHPIVNETAKFQYRFSPNFKDLDDIASFISREEPDIVLLEDIFLTPEQWNELCTRTKKLLKTRKSTKREIKFIPSPFDEITVGENKFYVSDIFLDKSKMKKFLATIGLQQHLLGLWEEGDLIVIEKLVKEVREDEDKFGPERSKIKRALKRCSPIILKPLSTSSGHGQFVINNIKELKQKINLLRYLKYRVPNKFLIAEKYIKKPIELCAIAGATDRGYTIITGIYYEKYRPDEYTNKGFEGQSRLMVARTYEKADAHVQHLFVEKIPDIMNKILRYLRVPFLYVEFLIDLEDSDNVYINEISYRPDDAGFITLASHETSQFELFMSSLELFITKGIRNCYNENLHFDYANKNGEWACSTLVEYKKLSIPKSYIAYETDEGRIEDHFKFRFYEKALARAEAPYRRIIGYQWHHQEQEEKDEGERILRMHAKDLGISPDLLERLVKALKMHKGKRRFLKKKGVN